jgi:hypothetical protein
MTWREVSVDLPGAPEPRWEDRGSESTSSDQRLSFSVLEDWEGAGDL